MGTRRADDPASQAWRAQAFDRRTRGSERDLLRALDWLPVEGAAQGLTAEEHRALLLHVVGLGRHVGARTSCPLRCGARAGWTRSESNGGNH